MFFRKILNRGIEVVKEKGLIATHLQLELPNEIERIPRLVLEMQ